MVARIDDLETILCQSEAEALVLECNLIKKFRPRYNILLKDGARYFGPYTDVGSMQMMLRLLKKLFPLRTCVKMGKRPCLNYHIKRCPGPCAGFISKAEYDERVHCVLMVLAGKTKDLEGDLTARMNGASERLEFEEAARFRDLLSALVRLNEGHKAVTGRAKKLMQKKPPKSFQKSR